MSKTVLVTGAAGMIGSRLTESLKESGYEVVGVDVRKVNSIIKCDLGNIYAFDSVVEKNKIDRIIHLAALAHTTNGKDYPKKLYYHLNVECAENVFKVAAKYEIPVLFISTVDVFGFQKGIVNANTECNPITVYGKTKYLAEQKLKESGASYDIFRFSPVYTETIKRDIQKRYYLRYPNWAYIIGKGSEYEILDINVAINSMISWCEKKPSWSVKIIKNEKLMNTAEYIKSEKTEGRAKHVLRFPRWIVVAGYRVLRITGKNKYTYLLSKAIDPLRSK